MEKGVIQVYTGDGKGKTTAALGACLRAYGQGFSVVFFQFLKAGKTGESQMAERLGWDFRQFATGRWFIDSPPDEQERAMVQEGLRIALQALQEKDLVVLDEFSHALNLGLITEEDFNALLEQKSDHVELILTGRDMPKYVLERADLITEMRLVKHPFQKGEEARRGIEY
ncbi:MAG TPA: cob(I)yrinic acid a,c-diamide adenosyltransferase [Bacillota bacterium]|jgi:cob(I)alamin adenosyltransferase|nr:cob(I)yrinic acid a,c-diamide adenosyltransferase [Bacillota bacterium]